MNKVELINRIVEETGLTWKDASTAIDGMVKVITTAVSRGEKVSVTGFGMFHRRFREGGTRRIPKTGEIVEVQAKYVPSFRPGKELKDAVK